MRKKKAASLGENGVMDTLDVSHVITPPVESKKPVLKAPAQLPPIRSSWTKSMDRSISGNSSRS